MFLVLQTVAVVALVLLLLLLLLLLLWAGFALASSWRRDRSVAEIAPRLAKPPSQFVPINGMQVHVRDEGPREDPSPIVLLHGFAGHLYHWQGWADLLKAERRVIRFDLPGFGLTGPAANGDYTVDAYVHFVRAALDALRVKCCVLAGNSFGGLIACQTALTEPGRVQRLILVCAAGYEFRPNSIPLSLKLALAPGINRVLAHVRSRALVRSAAHALFGDAARVTEEFVNIQYEMGLREGNRRALLEFLRQQHLGGERASRFAQLKLPTLILWGARDGLVPVEYGERFHRDIAGSRLVVFDDLGHIPQEEDPARTVAEVRRFLA